MKRTAGFEILPEAAASLRIRRQKAKKEIQYNLL